MSNGTDQPTVFNVLRGEAARVTSTPYGSVGNLFTGEGVEAVWVSKKNEEIEPGWFSQDAVDLLLVVKGELQLEFERADLEARVLAEGDFVILPQNTRCRAYRWPRDRADASVFVAFYPSGAKSRRHPDDHARARTHSGSRGKRVRDPTAELRTFLEPYDRAISRLYLATRKAVLAAAPEATELIYDAYNAVTTAYSFTHRLKDAFCHVAAYRDYVNLGFNRGAELPDPEGALQGAGRRIRHIRISAIPDLERPAVKGLIRGAVQQGRRFCGGAPAAPRSIVQAVHARKRRPSLSKR